MKWSFSSVNIKYAFIFDQNKFIGRSTEIDIVSSSGHDVSDINLKKYYF